MCLEISVLCATRSQSINTWHACLQSKYHADLMPNATIPPVENSPGSGRANFNIYQHTEAVRTGEEDHLTVMCAHTSRYFAPCSLLDLHMKSIAGLLAIVLVNCLCAATVFYH